MMNWYGDAPSAGGYALMIIAMILLLGLLITAIVLMVRFAGRGEQPPAHPSAPQSTAEQVLAERFARGDLDENEYRSRLTTLQDRTQP